MDRTFCILLALACILVAAAPVPSQGVAAPFARR
jgi:hypothetical protein